MRTRVHLLGVLAAFSLAPFCRAQNFDAVIFGSAASESSHGLTPGWETVTSAAVVAAGGGATPSDPSTGNPSDVVTGGLGLSGRRLLPRTPVADIYGGNLTFTVAVDPARQNYVTFKFWGSDASANIWLALSCNGQEVGDRHGGSQTSDGLWLQNNSWYPGRFVYRTLPLPLPMTSGQTSVTLKVRSLGWISTYDSGAYYGHYQKLMNAASPTIYEAVSHTGAWFDTSAESQGASPGYATPRATETESATLASVKSNTNNQLSTKMTASLGTLVPGDVQFLARCYDARENLGQSWITYPAGYTYASVVARIVAVIDYMVTQQSAGSGYQGSFGNSSWGGGFGPLGDAIRLVWPQINDGSTLPAVVAYGGSYGTTTRASAWSQALRASVDAGRFNRLTIANQAWTAAMNTYLANCGLLLVDSFNALYETEARRYLREACGLLPWTGNDQAGGGPTPVQGIQPYGPNWYMVTTQATTKDGDGFVGSDYGELGPSVYALGLIAGDQALLDRAVTMTRARCRFRYPAIDAGGFLVECAPEVIGERNNDMPGHIVYLGRSFSEDFLMAAQGASAVGGDLLGFFQQEMNEGQLFQMISSYADPYLPGRYATIKAMAQTGIKLPMSVGAADFAWVDTENMAVAAKKGEERFFANLNWRQPPGINGLAKVLLLTPALARASDIQADDMRFVSSGQTVITSSLLDSLSGRNPPDGTLEASGGTPMLAALRPDLSTAPSLNRDAGRGTGYTLRYGNWLVGINAHPTLDYAMKLPAGFTSAVDLVSGGTRSGPVTIPPKASVVFYLPATADANPTPSAPIYLSGQASSGQVQLTWSPAAGATSYVLQRRAAGGAYVTVASGLTGTGYTDTAGFTAGVNVYYQLTGVNSAGPGHPSPEVEVTTGAPAPWSSLDIGAPGVAGTTAFDTGVFTVAGSGGDIGGTADSFQFACVPMTGDGSITARVGGISSASTITKAGVMLRETVSGTNAPGARMAAAIQDMQSPGPRFPSRSSQNGNMAWQQGSAVVNPPVWLRVARAGSVFTASWSPDGKNWTVIGSATIPMNSTIYAGLAVCSRGGGLSYAAIDHVSAPGWSPPAGPATLVATRHAGDADLAWSAVGGATSGYTLKRGSRSGGPYAVVAAGLTGTGYTDPGLPGTAAGTTYYYAVSASNAQGESVDSPEASVTISAAPDAPGGLSVAALPSRATVAWQPVDGATGYAVYRATASGGPYTLLALGLTATNYTDAALSGSASYYYVVTASNASGESAVSTEIRVAASNLTITGFTPYTGLIALAPGVVFNLSNATGTYASSVVRAGGFTFNGGANASVGGTANEPANFLVQGSPSGTTNDLFGPLFLASGALYAKVIPNAAGNTTLTFASLARNPGTQLDFGHAGNAGGVGTSTVGNGTGTASVVFTLAPALTGGLLPYTFVNNKLTTYDAAYGLRSLNASELTTTLASGTATATNVTVSAARTVTSTTTVNALYLTSGGSLTGAGPLTVTSGAVAADQSGSIGVGTLAFGAAEGQINVANARTLTISSVVTGSGGLTIGLENYNANTANVVLAGANTFTGVTTLEGNDATMKVRLTNALALQNTTLDYNNYGASLQFGNGATNLAAATFGGLKGAQGLALTNAGSGGGGATLTVGGDNDSTVYAGAFTGVGGLVKTGGGTLTLSGASTSAGAAVVGQGTLNVTGSFAGPVTVNNGAVLSGTGTCGGAVTVNAGGTLAPGDGGTGAAGTLKVGALTLTGGAGLGFDLGAVSDRLALTGAYTGPASGVVTISPRATAGFGAGTYPLITGAAGINASGFALAAAALPASGYSYALTAASGTLSLVATAWTPIQTWRFAHFGTADAIGNAADLADPDGDGRSNKLEYATGTDPNVPDAGPVAVLGRTADGTRLTLTFTRIADPSLTYAVQASDDLITWQTVWTSTGAQNAAGPVTAVDTEPISAHARRFLRLTISP